MLPLPNHVFLPLLRKLLLSCRRLTSLLSRKELDSVFRVYKLLDSLHLQSAFCVGCDLEEKHVFVVVVRARCWFPSGGHLAWRNFCSIRQATLDLAEGEHTWTVRTLWLSTISRISNCSTDIRVFNRNCQSSSLLTLNSPKIPKSSLIRGIHSVLVTAGAPRSLGTTEWT